MKNLDLSKFGVQEMNTEEMSAVEGGNPLLILALFVLAVYIYECLK